MTKSDWFNQARFGMFVHWGLYSLPAGVWNGKKARHGYSEWIQNSEGIDRATYARLADQFNPTAFDADEWISEASRAGMKYFVITSKHHDGFALWPSKHSAFNIADATPFKRDVLGELATACRKYGLKFGLYYSHWQDWDGTGGDVTGYALEHAGYRRPTQDEFERYWTTKSLPQVNELIERYDPAMLWFDTWNAEANEFMTPVRQDQLIDLVRAHSGHCLINSRINFEKPSDRCDLLSMMDNTYPGKVFAKPWETSGTLNHSWAYHQLDFGWRSTEELIGYLINNASFGGNYQLNVGPTAEGRFQTAAVRRLREIGAWLDANGQSIYGTQSGPTGKQPWGVSTQRVSNGSRQLYLHLLNITPGTALHLPDTHANILHARVLESQQPIATEQTPAGLLVHLPVELATLRQPVIELTMKGNA